MGGGSSSCSTKKPDNSNRCNDNVGEEINSKNFCTTSGSSGLNKRRDYCENLGDDEWEYSGQGGTCFYNDCRNGSQMSGPCCLSNACCGIVGNSTKCRRKKFTGEPFECCSQDMACHEEINNDKNPYCFTDEGKKTCAPEYRSMSSNGCRNVMMDYCTGADVPPGQSQIWINRWTEGDRPCYRNVYRNLYDDDKNIACMADPLPNQNIPTNTQGLNYAQDLMYEMINKYLEDGGDLSASESSESNTKLNSTIWTMCNNTPGLCDKALFNYCANVTNDTLIRNSSLLQWCGCYMQPENYKKYTDLYEINRECTPTCGMQGVLKLSNIDNTDFKKCSQTTCIIDNISINIANSLVGNSGKGISFNQLCNSCAQSQGGHCNCTITNGTFDIINSQTGSININEQCTGNSVCYTEVSNLDGSISNTRIPCTNGPDDINPYIEVKKESEKNLENSIFYRNLIILGIFIFLVIIIIIIWNLTTKSEKNTKEKGIEKNKKVVKKDSEKFIPNKTLKEGFLEEK